MSSLAATVQAGFLKMTAAAARFAAFLGRAFFFLSIAALAFDALKSAFRFFNPISDAQKKQEERVESLTDKYKTLRGEIQRTNDTLADTSLVSADEAITARGNAASSLDVPRLIKDITEFQKLKKGTKGYKDLKIELRGVLVEAARLAPEFEVLNRVFEENLAFGEALPKKLINLANSLVKARQNLEALPRAAQSVNKE